MNILNFIVNNQSYIEDFIARITYHSNGIEGNSLSFAETYAIVNNDANFQLLEKRKLREIYEAMNHKDALRISF